MPGGQPSKLTSEIHELIVGLVRTGNYPEFAAQAAGIHPATYYRWMSRGKEERRGRYREFYDAIKKAVAETHTRNVQIVQKAAITKWQAAAWTLERRWPNHWGLRDRRELEEMKRQLAALEGVIRALSAQKANPPTAKPGPESDQRKPDNPVEPGDVCQPDPEGDAHGGPGSDSPSGP